MRLWPRPHRSFIETSILVADSKQTLFLEFYLLHKTVQHSRLVPYQPRSRNNERSSSVTSGRHLDCTDNGIYIFASKLFILIDHTPYPAIVDFRSARWLPYVSKNRQVLRATSYKVDFRRCRFPKFSVNTSLIDGITRGFLSHCRTLKLNRQSQIN